MEPGSDHLFPTVAGLPETIAEALLGSHPGVRPPIATGSTTYIASGDARQINGNVSTTFTGHIERVEAYFTAPLNQSSAKIEPSSTVPFAQDPDFVGRQDVIAELDAKFASRASHTRVALVGLGGMGWAIVDILFLAMELIRL